MSKIWKSDSDFLPTVFQAIERKQGALDDRKDQDDLLRELIQNHKSNRTRALASVDISQLRTRLAEVARHHPATRKIAKVGGRTPWLQNLFQKGTKAAIDPDYLDTMQAASSTGDEATAGTSDDGATESGREYSAQPATSPQLRVSGLQRDDATGRGAPSIHKAAAIQVMQSHRTSSTTTIDESSPLTALSMQRESSPKVTADPDESERVSRNDVPTSTHRNAATVPDIPESAVGLPLAAAVMGGGVDKSGPDQQKPGKSRAALAASQPLKTHSNMNSKVIDIASEDEDKPEPKSNPNAVRVKGLTLNAPKKVPEVPTPNRKRKFANRSEDDAFSPDSDSDVEVEPEPEPKAKKRASDSKKQIGRAIPAAPKATSSGNPVTKQRGPANTRSTTDVPRTMGAGTHFAQQRGPVDVTTPKDGNWVSKKMEKIEDDLFNAVLSFFQANKVETHGASNFVPSSSPELDKLYISMFKDEDWATKLTDIEAGNDSVELHQVHTLMGLFGAGITSMVFHAQLPWDLQTRLETALDTDLEMANKVFVQQYHDSFSGYVKRLKEQQILDPKFQEDKVASHARKLANELTLVVRPHLQRLQKGAVVEKPLGYKHWRVYLESAIQTAITVKTILSVSPHGPFSLRQPKIGATLDLARQKPFYELGRDVPLKALHSVLPAVVRMMDGESVLWARGVFIPYHAK